MAHNFFIFRNYTVEPLFDKIKGCSFSGYNEISFPNDFKYYVWLYFMPNTANSTVIAEEISFYEKRLIYLTNKIPSTGTLLCTTITDNNNFSFTTNNAVRKAGNKYNNTIFELSAKHSNVKVIDIKSFTSKYNPVELFENRHYYMSQMLINPKLANDFAKWFKQKISAIEGIRKKCLVLDLDNTLWKGVLGEDGVAGIKLGNTYPGNCFRDFQSHIKEIKNTGVIIAICSKNNIADVDQVFSQRDDMVLSYDDFAAVQINWKNKADNIKELAIELNINTDSMVFIDDSPFERENVKTMLPEVIVPDFPKQPYLLVDFIKEVYNNWFQIYELTNEDITKTKQYQQNKKRQKAIEEHGNIDDFLKEMKITLTISESNPIHIPRLAQMTQKTNQFNLTTKRYTEADITSLLKNGYIIWDAQVSDKFGDNGITALAIVKVEENTANIDSFLLSCRILGRGIETAFLNYILNKLFDKGINNITASFIPTTKNKQTEHFYENNGFILVSTRPNMQKKYKLELAEKRKASTLYYIR